MTPEEEQFWEDHRFCTISTLRKSSSPFATPVYYFYDEGNSTSPPPKHAPRQPTCFETHASLYVHPTRGAALQLRAGSGYCHHLRGGFGTRTRRIFSLFSTTLRKDFSTMLEEQQRQLMVITPTEVTSRLIVPGAR